MLKAALIAGCVAGICASLADMAVSEKYKPHIRTITALIIIISVAQPLLSVNLGELVESYAAEFELTYEQKSELAFSENVSAEASERLSDFISAKLVSAGIKPQSVSIELIVTGDGRFEVARVDVVISKEQLDRYGEIKQIVTNELLPEDVNVSWEE